MKLSIIIPSVNDPYLEKTIADIKDKAKGEYEIVVVKNMGLRDAVNKGVADSKGDYILKTDEHCMFDDGFDVKLLADIKDNWIVVPRRYFLDVEKWEVMDRRPVDYDRLVIDMPDRLSGVEWITRARERKDILLDENIVFQGSCYLMSKKHWHWMGGLQTEGYGQFSNEAIELALKTWLAGGKVMVNKKTWYAHKHRKFGRIKAPWGVKQGNKYSRDFWLNNRWVERIYDLDWLMRRFHG